MNGLSKIYVDMDCLQKENCYWEQHISILRYIMLSSTGKSQAPMYCYLSPVHNSVYKGTTGTSLLKTAVLTRVKRV